MTYPRFLMSVALTIAILHAATGCSSANRDDEVESGGAAATASAGPTGHECDFTNAGAAIQQADQTLSEEVHARLMATPGANLNSDAIRFPYSNHFEFDTHVVGNTFSNKTIKFSLDSSSKLLRVSGSGYLTLNRADDGTVWMKYTNPGGVYGELVSCFPLNDKFYAFEPVSGYGQAMSSRRDPSGWVDVETTLAKAERPADQ